MQPGFSLAPRDPFADVKDTLSSWDKCMAKDYCKWPVIVAIIVGGIIAFSIVFCIARCICCGAECAICCCKCCTCCCGSNSGHKRIDSANQGYPQPYPPQQYAQQPYASSNHYAEARSFAPPPPPPPPQISTQYQSHPAPSIARQPSNPSFNPQTNPLFARPASPERPQYATFDAHRKPANDDALPEMPSWKDARSVQVEVEDDAVVPEKRGDVELDRLNHNGSVPSGAAVGAAGVGMAAGMRNSPGPVRSPVSPMGDTYAYHNHANYDHDRRGSPAQSYSQYSQTSDPYSQPYTQPYASVAAQSPYRHNADTADSYYNTNNTPQDSYTHDGYNNSINNRYNSPAPPSYHTTAQPPNPVLNPYSYANDPVQRAQTSTPSAYPGQQTYQAFTPQGTGQAGYDAVGGQYMGVSRKPVEGSAREV